MTQWGKPRCRQCGQFISPDSKSGYCSACFCMFYDLVGKVPDSEIPRVVLRDWQYNRMKEQRDMLGEWYILCDWLERQPRQASDYAAIPESLHYLLDAAMQAQRQKIDVVFCSPGEGWRAHKDWQEKLEAAKAELTAQMQKARR